jgi:hypothetical protein
MKLIFIVLLIAAFFVPVKASWFFILGFVVLEGYVFLLSVLASKHVRVIHELNEQENKIFNKYYVYFKYPRASKSISASLSLVALSAFILVPWLLYNQIWIQSVIIAVNYFFAQSLSSSLNIRFYLHEAVEVRKREEFKEEMDLVDSVCRKIEI